MSPDERQDPDNENALSGGSSGDPAQSTVGLIDGTVQRATLAPPPASLTVQHASGVRLYALGRGSAVVIGRAAAAGLTIDDRSLSREHARFFHAEDGLWVEDLRSKNGTLIDGRRIQRERLSPGAVVHLGAVRVVVSLPVLAAPSPDWLLDHSAFVVLLRQEVLRNATFGRPLSLLMLCPASGASLAPWLQAMREAMRPGDRAGLFSDTICELLSPERGARAATALAEQILERATAQGVALRCGVATFPDSATDAEALEDHALTALRRAAERAPIQLAPSLRVPTVYAPSGSTESIVVQSPAMQRVFELARRVADADVPVLLLGETGVGKEVVASTLHRLGHRRDKPFVCVNCGALPESLLESVLFGHVRAAFTGAVEARAGVFEAAGAGTVFLDEIGELPARAQVALLRVIETRQVARVGTTEERRVRARIVAATNRDLEQMCRLGSFRRDLYYRVETVSITVPPLRERTEEIAALARIFVARAARETGSRVRAVAPDALACLERYGWPGNVRELRNVIDRAVLLATGDEIHCSDLPGHVVRPQEVAARPSPDGEEPHPVPDRLNLARYMRDVERALIALALEEAGGRRQQAAAALGLPVRTLRYKLDALQIAGHSPDLAVLDRVGNTGAGLPLRERLRAVEARVLARALALCAENKSAAARHLGISRSTLASRLKEHGLG